MKKMLILIIISILTFSFNVFALEYKIVNVSTTFSEDIEFSDVEKVKLIFFGEGIDYVDDASSIINIVELTKENNYSQTINNAKIVDKSNLFAIVDKDNYGAYNCDITLDTSVVDTANISIHISKNNTPKSEYSSIPSDILKKIIGNSTTINNNGDSNNNNNSANNNEDGEIIIGTTSKTTTNGITYKEELKKREEKEKKDTKKNNIVSIILFAIIGVILLIGLVLVVYKFMNANK